MPPWEVFAGAIERSAGAVVRRWRAKTAGARRLRLERRAIICAVWWAARRQRPPNRAGAVHRRRSLCCAPWAGSLLPKSS
eukprot:1400277-Prymnesium_polylepis.1